jgi:hypothetical protein
MLTSCACTQRQLESEEFRSWVIKLKETTGFVHRKVWEFCYITQALAERGMLAPGKSGLGFAVGQEPLADLFASYGCNILATDLDEDRARKAGWVHNGQHATSLAILNKRGICSTDDFQRHVSFRNVDMNSLPSDLGQHDFIWSSCSIEHLGSFRATFAFLRRMTAFLRSGGVAVHTTEFNVSSDKHTLIKGPNILFRKQDFRRLVDLMEHDGHRVAPFDFELGDQPADHFVDEPPYKGNPHLKLRIEQYVCTSAGIIITAGDKPSNGYWRWLSSGRRYLSSRRRSA